VLDDTGGDPLTVATNLAYPVADALLLGLVAGLLGVFGVRAWREWSAAICGFAVLGVADTIYLYGVASGSYAVGGVLDAAWPAGMVLVGAAAWQKPGRLDGNALGDRGFLPVPIAAGLCATGLAVARPLPAPRPGRRVGRGGLRARGRRSAGRHVPRQRADAAREPPRGRDRRTHWARQPARADRRARAPARGLGARAGRARAVRPRRLQGLQRPLRPSRGRPAAAAPRRPARRRRPRRPRVPDGRRRVLRPLPSQRQRRPFVGRARQALSEEGEGFTVTASAGTVALPGEARTVSEALSIADRRMYAQKRGGRSSASNQSKDVLLRAVHERSPHLGAHGGEVAELATLTAQHLGLEPDVVRAVRQAAELHDIGKLAIPDSILTKPGPLDEDEWAFMRRHTIIGERILAAAPALLDVAPLVRSSHEHWDGAGYPDGLARDEIPLGARVICVCDAWDAMVTDRPYRRALPRADALAELERCAGSQFDPAVVEAFRAVVGRRRPLAPVVRLRTAGAQRTGA
jgi:two-component system, cell cycle response regulator